MHARQRRLAEPIRERPGRAAQVSAYSGSGGAVEPIVACVPRTRTRRSTSRSSTTRPTTGDYHEAIVAGHRGRSRRADRRARRVAVHLRLHLRTRSRSRSRTKSRTEHRRHLLDRLAGDRALVGPRPQVRRSRSDDVPLRQVRQIQKSVPEPGRARAASTARGPATARTRAPATRARTLRADHGDVRRGRARHDAADGLDHVAGEQRFDHAGLRDHRPSLRRYRDREGRSEDRWHPRSTAIRLRRSRSPRPRRSRRALTMSKRRRRTRRTIRRWQRST